MTHKQFGIQLAVVSGVTAVGLWALLQHPKLEAYPDITWLSLGAFIILSILMYLAGKRSATSENKNTFTATVLGFTGGKMFLAVIILIAYMLLTSPADKFFIIPFFIVYVVFTIFETYFMTKLGRT